jgi:hypothetical protein
MTTITNSATPLYGKGKKAARPMGACRFRFDGILPMGWNTSESVGILYISCSRLSDNQSKWLI